LTAGVEASHRDPRRQSFGQPRSQAVQPGIDIRRQLAERREPRHRRDRIAVERSTVADRPGSSRIEDLQDVGPAAERRERVAAGDDLPERRQVGRTA
jgi:hypothetical protein